MRTLLVSLLLLLSSIARAQSAPPHPPPIDINVVGSRWQIMQDSDGRLYRVRRVTTPLTKMWAPGLAVWLGAYVAGGLAAIPATDGTRTLAWVPFVGPIFNAAISYGPAPWILWPLDSAAQIAGCIVFVVGLEKGPAKLERRAITAGPTAFVGGGHGVALSGRF